MFNLFLTAVITLIVGLLAGICLTPKDKDFHGSTDKAYIVVTDRKGNRVYGTKPHVVCLAERPNETLICRVEAVR